MDADRLKWNARHAERRDEPLVPEPFLLEALALLDACGLPRERTALDVACGRGRHALALARAGFAVTALDVSDVALDLLARQAAAEGLDVTTRRVDLDDGLPPGRFGLVVVMHFLDRRLMPAVRDAVAPGGALVFQTFTAEHAERTGFHRALCLEPGELRTLAGELDVLLQREHESDGRWLASLLARRPPKLVSDTIFIEGSRRG